MRQRKHTFDVIQYTEDLEKVGVPANQAKVHARALEIIIDSELVTKADLHHLAEKTKLEIRGLEEKTKSEIRRLEEKTQLGFEQVKLEICRLEEKTQSEIHQMMYKTIFSLGSIVVAAMTVLGIVIKLT